MARKLHDWKAVQAYHDEGHGFVECSRRFGFKHTAWIKAIKRGALSVKPSPFRDRRRKYDWSAIQAYYNAGFSYRQTRMTFGFCNAAWIKAVRRGEIKPRRAAKSLDQVLASGSSRWLKKAKLLREGHLLNECSDCGISEWRGRRLAIQIDHINGVKDDWRIENLRMLCPNCHSQTSTYAGRNVRRVSGLQEAAGSL
jgi:5-methylcytosine-specific restriction endonuclease McrA